MVVVDTEEEFDWSAPFDRGSTSVTAMREVWRLQAVFDEFDIVPVYVIDYPGGDPGRWYRPVEGVSG